MHCHWSASCGIVGLLDETLVDELGVPLALLGIHDPLEEMQLLLLVLGEGFSFTRTIFYYSVKLGQTPDDCDFRVIPSLPS